MKKTNLLLATLLIALAFFAGCQKELSDDPFVPAPVNQTFTPNINTTIKGRVIDENDKPVQGAVVRAGNTTTVTDINGEFTLNNARVHDKAAFVLANKTGYFNGSRTIMATEGNVHYVEMKLLPNQSIGTIDMATGGSVALANGTSVALPASSVVVASNNAPYNGLVNVALAWIDPTSDDLERQMPGDLRGIDENNSQVGMISYGMVAVELRSASGEKLQVAPGKKATVKFFLPASIAGTAPTQMALWSFQESNGLWKQEGFATKAGNFYNAEVSHFSFWNCDAPFSTMNFKATVKDANGNPLVHARVRVKRTTSNNYSYGYTDSAGVVTGLVPANEPLVLEVVSICGTVIHTENIGPFSSPANITVTVTNSVIQTVSVTGTVTGCTGLPLAKGIADLVTGQRTYRTSIVNGTFNFNITTCAASQPATLIVIDTAGGQQSSTTLTLNAGVNNAGALTACGTSIAEFINMNVNGTTFQFLPPADSMMAYYNMQNSSTVVSGTRMNSGSFHGIEFRFEGNTVGPATITNLRVTAPNNSGSLPPATTMPMNITEFGPAGGFVAGNFTGNIVDSTTTRTVQCSFRVRRN